MSHQPTQISRRTVAKGAAWSVPVIAIAAHAPAIANSVDGYAEICGYVFPAVTLDPSAATITDIYPSGPDSAGYVIFSGTTGPISLADLTSQDPALTHISVDGSWSQVWVNDIGAGPAGPMTSNAADPAPIDTPLVFNISAGVNVDNTDGLTTGQAMCGSTAVPTGSTSTTVENLQIGLAGNNAPFTVNFYRDGDTTTPAYSKQGALVMRYDCATGTQTASFECISETEGRLCPTASGIALSDTTTSTQGEVTAVTDTTLTARFTSAPIDFSPWLALVPGAASLSIAVNPTVGLSAFAGQLIADSRATDVTVTGTGTTMTFSWSATYLMPDPPLAVGDSVTDWMTQHSTESWDARVELSSWGPFGFIFTFYDAAGQVIQVSSADSPNAPLANTQEIGLNIGSTVGSGSTTPASQTTAVCRYRAT